MVIKCFNRCTDTVILSAENADSAETTLLYYKIIIIITKGAHCFHILWDENVVLKIGLCFSINWQAQWNIRYCMHPKIPTYIVKCCSCMLSLFRHRFDIEIWSGNIERIPNRGVLSVEWITHISHCVSTLWHLWPHKHLQLTFSLPTKAYKGLLSLLAFLMKTKGTVGLH